MSVDTSFQDSVSCNGLFDGSASILGAGGNGIYTYLWSDGQTTSTANNLTAGTYNVTITDQKGCFKDTSVTVLEPDALLIASMSMDSASCNGVADGTATANGITGGNGINSFSWNTTPVQTTNPATGLAAGNYTITVTDQKGCFITRDTTVLEPVALSIDPTVKDSVSCNGFADGTENGNAISGGRV